ncbi:hypothetical protein IQ255_18070 [Pleurocapsales cyanobacterium LEGE 10410]|nr:hypothetical protein [Pleurocapsales cyanobacterium LEGE 10410]
MLSALAPFICLAGIVVLQGQEYKKSAQKLNRADYLSQEQEQARLIKFQQQTPSLGFDNLKANWTYLNFVQYFGDENARKTIGYKLVPDYFETISQIDPHFTQAHLRLSIANSMYAGDPEKTIALMAQVLQSVDPESEQAAMLWTSKGLDQLLFLGDKQAAIESYKMAAQWAALTNGDRSNNITIKDLDTALASTTEIELKEAQVRAWSSVLVHIKDNQRKREIIEKIGDLKQEILALEQSAEAKATR